MTGNPDHIPPNMKRSLELYERCGLPTGDCLRAILSGDLFQAFARADPQTVASMPDIVAYIRHRMPSQCFGSELAVDRWIEMHSPRFAADRSGADVKERPILFKGRLVRRILAGGKTQTRRIMKPQPEHLQVHTWKGKTLYDAEHRIWWWKTHSFENLIDFDDGRRELAALSPYGVVGDRLWVKETFYCDDYRYPDGPREELLESMEYRADHDCTTWEAGCPCADDEGRSCWRPSIHMPRWASRISLDIVTVRAERLLDITEEDAIAEGVAVGDIPADDYGPRRIGYCAEDDGKCVLLPTARAVFEELWKSINGPESWDANPWVWVIEFKPGEAASCCGNAILGTENGSGEYADYLCLACEHAQDDELEADECIFDDSTDCDCSRCSGAQVAWERLQGWEPDR